ncbi:unnamed protein product [Linum trigynum]|uniref:Uncharacterized protein n=1 Tax=Linum trigynum TaxID=586398 RepID=A0AAV2FG18_9ROSI
MGCQTSINGIPTERQLSGTLKSWSDDSKTNEEMEPVKLFSLRRRVNRWVNQLSLVGRPEMAPEKLLWNGKKGRRRLNWRRNQQGIDNRVGFEVGTRR